ncbi:hypothetical protein Nepgr_004026 [Nepenthes gracilis]|uniref:Uncharacterized protein n=1 Tax=Nepenthes gracilis TaxID=150966 RepID=A0AAD3XEL9_NEPGR|nr:hypothetical protein Nepgr_004026 [Nepenthes gracilis]
MSACPHPQRQQRTAASNCTPSFPPAAKKKSHASRPLPHTRKRQQQLHKPGFQQISSHQQEHGIVDTSNQSIDPGAPTIFNINNKAPGPPTAQRIASIGTCATTAASGAAQVNEAPLSTA